MMFVSRDVQRPIYGGGEEFDPPPLQAAEQFFSCPLGTISD